MTQTTHTTPKSDDRSMWTLWIGLLSGPVVYSAYFLIVYTTVDFGCKGGLWRTDFLGLGVITLSTLVLTVVAFVLTLISGIVAYRRWRHSRDDEGLGPEAPMTFMSFVGIWLNGLFTLVILLTGIPVVMLPICQWI